MAKIEKATGEAWAMGDDITTAEVTALESTEKVTEYTESQLLDMLQKASDTGKAEARMEKAKRVTTPATDLMPVLDEGVQGGTYTVTYNGGEVWSSSRMGRGKAIAFITGLQVGGVKVDSVVHTPKELK